MTYIYISMIFFALGAIFTFYKKLSYYLATAGAAFAFIASIIYLTVSGGSKFTFAASMPGMKTGFSSNTFNLMGNISLQLGLDHISSLFLMIASISWIAIALYSVDYGEKYSKKMPLSVNAIFFGMLLVITAKDAISFMLGWEVATIFLYISIVEHKKSFKEAFEFLAFGEISTISLIVAFAIMFAKNSTFLFINSNLGGLFLFMASIGFAAKMDIYPFHTWMTKTYPKSPSNIAAILSGPLTLMSTYGLVRILFISNQVEWWGVAAIILGGFSAFWGGLQAAAAKKIKLLPAYSTIENNGMILSAIGLSVVASISNIQVLSEFAMLTAIILIFAHTVSKTLLFMSVGHAKKALNEDSIDNVRGIWSAVGKIPAISMVTSGLSFSAFPPLIGFLGEWMVLEALFQSYKFGSILDRLSAAFSGILIALAMGLAAFSMVKLMGYTALGYDHEKKAEKIHCVNMNIAEIGLTSIIILSGLLSPLLIRYIGYGDFLFGLLGVPKPFLVVSSKPIFGVVSPTFLSVVIGVLLTFPLTFYLSKKSKVRRVNAWNGGKVLEENEYYTVPAYSFTLEYILRKVYSTKEVKKGKERFVLVKDITGLLYSGIIKATVSISKSVSLTLMNGKVSYYILYTIIIFALIFFIAR